MEICRSNESTSILPYWWPDSESNTSFAVLTAWSQQLQTHDRNPSLSCESSTSDFLVSLTLSPLLYYHIGDPQRRNELATFCQHIVFQKQPHDGVPALRASTGKITSSPQLIIISINSAAILNQRRERHTPLTGGGPIGRQQRLEIQSRQLNKKKKIIFFGPESETDFILVCVSRYRTLYHTSCDSLCLKIW